VDHGLPKPKANLTIAGREVDLLWTDARMVIEVDGAAVHQTTRAFHEDRRRDRFLAARGFQVVRVTELDLENGPALAAEMKALRGQRLADPAHR
jgi:very-short-patch-repair endonuclease